MLELGCPVLELGRLSPHTGTVPIWGAPYWNWIQDRGSVPKRGTQCHHWARALKPHIGTGASMGQPVLALILQLHQRNSDQIVAPFDTIKHGSLIGQYIFEKVRMVCSGPHAIGRFLHRTTISKAYLCLMFCFLN